MIRVKLNLNSIDVIDVLTDLFTYCVATGVHTLDNGPEFVAETA